MNDRTNVLQRILNLRELATNNTSEAEAMNAMKVADRLMHSYRVEEAELALAEGLGEIKVEVVNETRSDLGLTVGRNRHKVQSCLWALARYCEVKVVLKGRRAVNAIGDRPDTELFWYLLDLIRDALDREYANWKRGQQAVGRGAKASFQLAMANRINARLRDMIAERNAERQQAVRDEARLLNKQEGEIRMAVNNGDLRQLTSTALVLFGAAQQKREAVQSAYEEVYKNVRLGTASGFSYRSGNNAAAAGRSAGNRVGLGRPVSSGSRGLLS